MSNEKKYVKFKNGNFDGGIQSEIFHRENIGKIFEVVEDNHTSIRIKGSDLNFYNDRFDVVKLVNLPDELFTI